MDSIQRSKLISMNQKLTSWSSTVSGTGVVAQLTSTWKVHSLVLSSRCQGTNFLVMPSNLYLFSLWESHILICSALFTHLWYWCVGSEDSLLELVLSFHHVVAMNELKLSVRMADTFTHWATLAALTCNTSSCIHQSIQDCFAVVINKPRIIRSHIMFTVLFFSACSGQFSWGLCF